MVLRTKPALSGRSPTLSSATMGIRSESSSQSRGWASRSSSLGTPGSGSTTRRLTGTPQEVKMSRCAAACATCRDEVRAERRIAKATARILRSIRAEPFPEIRALDAGEPGVFGDSAEDLPGLYPDPDCESDDGDTEDFTGDFLGDFGDFSGDFLGDNSGDFANSDEPVEDGDRIFYTQFQPPPTPEHI